MEVEIKDLGYENIDDLVSICYGEHTVASTLKEGALRKRAWIKKALHVFGSCAKIAYVENKPIGFIEFYPIQVFPVLRHMLKDRKVILITCVFVRGKRTKGLQRGIPRKRNRLKADSGAHKGP